MIGRLSAALVLLLAAGVTAACTSTPKAPEQPAAPPASIADGNVPGAADEGAAQPSSAVDGEAPEAAAETEEEEPRSFLDGLLMYLPNRFIDLFDVARAGVHVGLGLGAEVAATEVLQVKMFGHSSTGIGLETLRQSPVFAATEVGVGFGRFGRVGLGTSWYRTPNDFRVGVYAGVVGAHVAIEPVEILDFLLGFLTIDIKDDDL